MFLFKKNEWPCPFIYRQWQTWKLPHQCVRTHPNLRSNAPNMASLIRKTRAAEFGNPWCVRTHGFGAFERTSFLFYPVPPTSLFASHALVRSNARFWCVRTHWFPSLIFRSSVSDRIEFFVCDRVGLLNVGNKPLKVCKT